MKAAFIEQFGGPEVLKYGDLPDPVAAAGEVVVGVVAASVNGADWKARRGQYSQALQLSVPVLWSAAAYAFLLQRFGMTGLVPSARAVTILLKVDEQIDTDFETR